MQKQSTNAQNNVSTDETINQLLLKNHALEKSNREKESTIKALQDFSENLLRDVDRNKRIISAMGDLCYYKLEKEKAAYKPATVVQGLNKFAVIYSELQFN